MSRFLAIFAAKCGCPPSPGDLETNSTPPYRSRTIGITGTTAAKRTGPGAAGGTGCRTRGARGCSTRRGSGPQEARTAQETGAQAVKEEEAGQEIETRAGGQASSRDGHKEQTEESPKGRAQEEGRQEEVGHEAGAKVTPPEPTSKAIAPGPSKSGKSAARAARDCSGGREPTDLSPRNCLRAAQAATGASPAPLRG